MLASNKISIFPIVKTILIENIKMIVYIFCTFYSTFTTYKINACPKVKFKVIIDNYYA